MMNFVDAIAFRRKLISFFSLQDGFLDVPVILVGNKTDQYHDRMVEFEEGQKRAREIACACFHEISVRESIDQVNGVFRDACRFWRVLNRYPKLKRSTSDVHDLHSDVELIASPEGNLPFCHCDLSNEKRRSILILRRRCWDEEEPDEHDELNLNCENGLEIEPFRSRASTDGTLFSRPKKWRIPPINTVLPALPSLYRVVERRNSISMRGNAASY
jgi:hypothetical protein